MLLSKKLSCFDTEYIFIVFRNSSKTINKKKSSNKLVHYRKIENIFLVCGKKIARYFSGNLLRLTAIYSVNAIISHPLYNIN